MKLQGLVRKMVVPTAIAVSGCGDEADIIVSGDSGSFDAFSCQQLVWHTEECGGFLKYTGKKTGEGTDMVEYKKTKFLRGCMEGKGPGFFECLMQQCSPSMVDYCEKNPSESTE